MTTTATTIWNFVFYQWTVPIAIDGCLFEYLLVWLCEWLFKPLIVWLFTLVPAFSMIAWLFCLLIGLLDGLLDELSNGWLMDWWMDGWIAWLIGCLIDRCFDEWIYLIDCLFLYWNVVLFARCMWYSLFVVTSGVTFFVTCFFVSLFWYSVHASQCRKQTTLHFSSSQLPFTRLGAFR